MDWQETIRDIEERLFPHFECDIWERGLYYFLLGQTRIAGLEVATIPLARISEALRCSVFQARKTIRLLADKGLILLEQTRQGHSVSVMLPRDLDLPDVGASDEPDQDIEELDFYAGRAYIEQLLAREKGQCFYCMRDINESSCELDHVISQVNGGGNSYRNIVASCHQCNTTKHGGAAEDHLRRLLRKGYLSELEFEGRIQAIEALQNGELKPRL
jgi:hypothetical protein